MIQTTKCINPKFKDWLLVKWDDPVTKKPTIVIVPKQTMTDLMILATKRFDNIAPLAPYPGILGIDFQCNGTVFKWATKKLLDEYNKYYKTTVEAKIQEVKEKTQ